MPGKTSHQETALHPLAYARGRLEPLPSACPRRAACGHACRRHGRSIRRLRGAATESAAEKSCLNFLLSAASLRWRRILRMTGR